MGDSSIIALAGKGGVGKTSVSAAMVRLIMEHRPGARVLTIDADPAVGLATALGVAVAATLDDIRRDVIASAESGEPQEALELLGEARFRIFDTLVEKPGFSFLAIGRPESAGCYCKVNAYLKEVIGLLGRRFDYVIIDGEAVLMQDAAFELGGENKPAVHLTCVTTDESLVPRDEILVLGPELSELHGASPYARIALVCVADIESDDETDTDAAHRAIQSIDFVKYHVFPKGYMMRTSAQTHREQVRISKEAVAGGITFRAVGSAFLRRYHQDANVQAVQLIFVTDPSFDYKALLADAKTAKSITQTLSKIIEGLPTDCGTCALKPVCDEVDGMKELHFGKG